MLKSGKELKVFSVKADEFKRFTEEAKRYGVLYSALINKKTKMNDGIIDIPVQVSVFGKGDNAVTVDTENIYLTEWKNLNSSGLSTVAYSLVNYQDGYMINLDKSEIGSLGIRNYRSQNCWIIYSADSDEGKVTIPEKTLEDPELDVSVDGTDVTISLNENATGYVVVSADGSGLTLNGGDDIGHIGGGFLDLLQPIPHFGVDLPVIFFRYLCIG